VAEAVVKDDVRALIAASLGGGDFIEAAQTTMSKS
jgi:hypothetical protein